MRCNVLFFAQVRDAVGKDREEIALRDGATVQDALTILATQHPIIAAMSDRIAIAVDEQYCTRSVRLRDGCTIALIPPVSGG